MMQLTFGLGGIEAEFWRWMFIMTRIGAALMAAPFFGATSVPVQVRVIATGAIAVLVCNWLPVSAPANLLSIAGMLAVAGEVLIGLTLGMVLQAAFAAPVIAAELVGAGMGMSIATAADPNTGAHSPALGQYYAVVLTLMFLALGGHLLFIELVLKSYETFPPGQTWLGAERLALVTDYGATMLLTALAIALPVTLVLLFVQFAAGMLSRSAPSLNLFSLGLPAGVLAGIGGLILSAPLLPDAMAALTADALHHAEKVITR